MAIWLSELGGGDGESVPGGGGGSYTIVNHTVGRAITADDLDKLHIINATSAEAFDLLDVSGSTYIGRRIGFAKANSGNLDINAFNQADGTNTLLGETDIENTDPSETYAEIWLVVSGDGEWRIDGVPFGSWQ